MNTKNVILLAVLLASVGVNAGQAKESQSKDIIQVHSHTNSREPIGKQGLTATYRIESGGLIPGSVVQTFTLVLGPLGKKNGNRFQWLHLQATKANGEQFNVWILTDRYPPSNSSAALETTAR